MTILLHERVLRRLKRLTPHHPTTLRPIVQFKRPQLRGFIYARGAHGADRLQRKRTKGKDKADILWHLQRGIGGEALKTNPVQRRHHVLAACRHLVLKTRAVQGMKYGLQLLF
ncbi:uncharacterized protein Tco025E_00102 [Trypanosoma conorhini]|uniref:Uncharacterized protein n=1 Tax=Trypanosoma conorhini TaxID=83891 RepID=A0A3R7SBM0_9TRYP|nr:uncharacterized protein Tco025E_00102 [Trypanosoma conorhini]RNF27718.1 hypothetical protein Tco025E_00102 [Trypanosoma conorhini]